MHIKNNMAYNASDFIMIPQFEGVSIAKEQSHNGLNWYDTHKQVISESTEKTRFSMPTVPKFMQHYQNVIEAKKRDKALYDGNRNPLTQKDLNKVYKKLTSDCWVWLDAMFSKITGSSDLLVNSNHILFEVIFIPKSENTLETCIMDDCFVALDFNKQGFPISQSEIQKYRRGKNIHFFHPIGHSKGKAVAGFGANSGRAALDCDWNPQVSYSALGVFVCTEGATHSAQKICVDDSNKTGNEEVYTKAQIKTALNSLKIDGLEKAIFDELRSKKSS